MHINAITAEGPFSFAIRVSSLKLRVTVLSMNSKRQGTGTEFCTHSELLLLGARRSLHPIWNGNQKANNIYFVLHLYTVVGGHARVTAISLLIKLSWPTTHNMDESSSRATMRILVILASIKKLFAPICMALLG